MAEKQPLLQSYVSASPSICRRVALLTLLLAVLLLGHLLVIEVSDSSVYPIVDTHVDLPIYARFFSGNHIDPAHPLDDNFSRAFNFSTGLPGQVDLPRLRAGGAAGIFWSVFTLCDADKAHLNLSDTSSLPSTSETAISVLETTQQIDLVHRLHALYPNDLHLATTADDFSHLLHRHRHKHRHPWSMASGRKPPIAGSMGIEGLHQIGGSPSALRAFHRLGVRYATLTHTCSNAYADASPVDDDESLAMHGDCGLSGAGVLMVKEMNRVGMIVDLSHTSTRTMEAALNHSRAPVLFSHSNARTVHPHHRNVPDHILRRLPQNRGVVQITFLPEFITSPPSEASADKVVDHIAHIVSLAGWKHVGIGSDFDGMPQGPKDLPDVASYPVLIQALKKRFPKVTKSELAGFLGGNVLRVWKEVERVSREMHREGVMPLEEELGVVPRPMPIG
ncbi:hypothetical protein PYCC9005_003645 [Savitreella phatthalungensis]